MEPFLLPTLILGGFSLYAGNRLYGTAAKRAQFLGPILDASRGARILIDSNNNILFTNSKCEVLLGASELKQLSQLHPLFQETQNTPSILEDAIKKAQQGETSSLVLSRMIGEQPHHYNVLIQSIPALHKFVHLRIDDITEDYEQNLRLSEDQRKLIDTMDNSPAGFFSVNEEGRFTFVNATFARWVNETPDVILRTRHLHDFILSTPKNAAAYDIKEGGGVRQITDIQMKTSDNREFLASITQTVVHDGDGGVCTRAVVNDLTSQQAIRQALEDSEFRFKKFFEESPVGVAIVNLEGIVHDCNAALAKMLGRPITDIEGKIYTDMIDMNDWQHIADIVDRIRKGENITDPLDVGLWVNKKSENLPCHVFARMLSSGGNFALHFIDLSQQKNLESKFIQSQKMQAVGQLAGGIAHDFNNLLTAIIGFSDLLLLRHKPGDSSFGDIQQIKQNSNRAANLVRQLLAFSRQQTLRPQVQDITDILTELSHLMRRLIGVNIELKLIHGHDLGFVKVDGGQMEQVFVNMAVNARDAMADGGALTITTSHFTNDTPYSLHEEIMPAGEWVRVDVKDTGTGIPPEILDRIFEPFFTTKDIGKGTGLGLATVHGIIRQTGGYLGVDSIVGKGTTFSVFLPCVTDDEKPLKIEPSQSEELERDLTGSARILLVEDEDAVRTFSTRALTNKGYEVLTAENGESGLIVFNEQIKPVDLLITDVMMPGVDGPTLAKEIRAKQPDLKIIFISGYTEERLKDTLGEGVFFLPKPFTLKQLAAKVKEVLEC